MTKHTDIHEKHPWTIRQRMPKTIQWLVKLLLIYLTVFTLFRVATLISFLPPDVRIVELFPSFWLGLRYDLRWIAFVLMPIALLSLFPKLSPFYSERGKKWWTAYLALITLVLLFFFGADFGHFAYVSTRLNASALNFYEDARISFEMIWQSYPIVWILLGLAGAAGMIAWMFRRTHVSVEERNINIHKFAYRRIWHLAAMVVLAWFLIGFPGIRPLRWSDAFALNDNFKSYLALNPLQNFFTTVRFRKPMVDVHKARQYYPRISDLLQLDRSRTQPFKYDRIIHPGSNALESKPNIVLVLCESYSMYKSSMSGNPLNTTPYFDSLTKQGIFFERCFTPTFGTARGVFALLTGIPDVQLSKFSTRNEASLRQHTIINSLEGYSKHYFLGGSSEFNNYRGILSNIRDVNMHEEGSFRSPKLNVWGISDKDLFLEADSMLRQEKQPFFALIQTSGNHRPYSIPARDSDFVRKPVTPEQLKAYGFDSEEEYHAFCYTDYAIQQFIERAKKAPYFNNTIFIFVGDHGVEGNARAMYPAVWTDERLNDEHVPLLFYAPALLRPEKRSETVSQIDVLPTMASLLAQPYLNRTLGRDLLDPRKQEHTAFIIHHDEGKIGVVTNDYFYIKNLWIKKEKLYPIREGLPDLTPPQRDSIMRSLSNLTSAYYETARWMLVNNRP